MANTTRVSTTSSGGQGDGGSYLSYNYYGAASAQSQVFNPDGSEIVFTTRAENLAGGASQGVVIKNLKTGQETVAYTPSGSANVSAAQFTRDGTSVIFQTNSSEQDIVEKNIATGATQTIAPSSGSSGVNLLAASNDGSRVAYGESNQSGSTYTYQAYVKNFATGATVKVGTGTRFGNTQFDQNLTRAIYSTAPTPAGTTQINSKDLSTGTAGLVSATQSNVAGNAASFGGLLSRDGTEAVFTTRSTNLSAAAMQGGVFVKNLSNGGLNVVAANSGSADDYVFNNGLALSASGNEVVFTKDTYTISGQRTTNAYQLQIADLGAHTTRTVSPTVTQTHTGNGNTSTTDGSSINQAIISTDGSKVAYLENTIHATNSSFSSTNQLYVYDLTSNKTTLVAQVTGQTVSNFYFSPDGGEIAYETFGSQANTTTIYDLASGKSTTVPSSSVYFSPDGKTFAYDSTDATQVPNDTNNASDVFVAPVCFASGTLIRTTRGDLAVEALAVGDLVVTASGAARPIHWLGHRRVDCRSHPAPMAAQPIRIAAHAFGEGRPARDLYVSPGHAICVDVIGEALVPALALVDGTNVTQVDVDQVTYWHVELDGHDILLAENLACESYLEMGNRSFFAESGIVALAAMPDAPARTHADFCRPFHAGGALVEAVRSVLAKRAATRAPVRARRAS